MQSIFKSATGTTGQTATACYTVPAGMSALINAAQVTSLYQSSTTANLQITKSGVSTFVSAGIPLASGAACSMLSGTLALEAGDSIKFSAGDDVVRARRTLNVAGNNANVRGIKKLNGILFAYGSGADSLPYLTKSLDDGETWTPVVLTGLASSTYITDMDFGGGVYAMICGSSPTSVFTSTDYTAWTARTVSFVGTPKIIKYAASLWVAGGDGVSGTNLYTTSDPTGAWTARASGLTSLSSVEYSTSLSLWIIGCTSTTANLQIATAPANGVTWTVQTTAGGGEIMSIAASGNRIVAIASVYNFSLTTTNGSTWELLNTVSTSTASATLPVCVSGNPQGITYANGMFVGTQGANSITTSTDGLFWTKYACSSYNVGTDIVVSLSSISGVIYSGTSWIFRDSGAGRFNVGKVESLAPTGMKTISYVASIAEITP